jgi:hypothetical protein
VFRAIRADGIIMWSSLDNERFRHSEPGLV